MGIIPVVTNDITRLMYRISNIVQLMLEKNRHKMTEDESSIKDGISSFLNQSIEQKGFVNL